MRENKNNPELKIRSTERDYKYISRITDRYAGLSLVFLTAGIVLWTVMNIIFDACIDSWKADPELNNSIYMWNILMYAIPYNRLWGWAVIAQFAYYLAGFPWYEGNILFAFAVAAQVLTWCETRSGWRTAAAILLMALWGPLSGTSYGIAGLLMLAVSYRLYRAEDRAERLALLACLLAVIPALNLASSDVAAVAGLVMTVLTVGLVSCTGKSLPRFWYGDFFPVFYACHLAVLGVLAL